MAPPFPKTTGISPAPLSFGLNTLSLNFIPPLFYFLSKTLEGMFFPPQPFAPLPGSKSNLLGPVSPNTCSLTEPEEISIYNDRRRIIQAGQSLLACFFTILLCLAARYSETKLNRSSDKGRCAYFLEQFKLFTADSNDPTDREWDALIPHMVPSHNDYRISQRREATILLFRVMISGCLCPIAEYLLCAKEGVAERFYNQTRGENNILPLFIIYLVFRYGTLPCVLTGLTSDLLMGIIFKGTEDDRAVGFWDRWIEKWIKAHQMENAVAEAKWMAEMNIIEPGDGNLYIRSPGRIIKTQTMYAK
ncbi:hypothetical protein B0H65DRAFT_215361 [Neurospora tetraspora]|uniref:Uncharacterized protein n=1 Tax=Neurospora tetraspora TaxID=94610 RepID=A0AAE0MQE0_9PEZI|nr:hypothetical protein B0H65DRAFT_215361 [Neurospora tetraspora]